MQEGTLPKRAERGTSRAFDRLFLFIYVDNNDNYIFCNCMTLSTVVKLSSGYFFAQCYQAYHSYLCEVGQTFPFVFGELQPVQIEDLFQIIYPFYQDNF